jgi:lipopolysaccharide export system protein LptA
MVAAAGLLWQSLWALPSDATATMYISAQTAEVDKLTGNSVYQGDVKIDRGTTHVTADKLTVQSADGKAVLLTAYGNPKQLAHYQTQTDVNKPILDAYAIVIKYYPPQHVVELIGSAHVTQGHNQIDGPHLQYDLINKVLVAVNDNAKLPGKTSFVIDPNEINQGGSKS